MSQVAFIAMAMLLPVAGLAQGLAPEDPAAFASFPVAPPDRGVRARSSVIIPSVAPRAQGRTSTCVGWAVAYAAGSYFHRKTLRPGAALSPAFAYALGNGDDRCLKFSKVSVFLDAMRDVGALPIEEYAFDGGYCGRIPTAEERRRAAAWRIPGWAVIPGKSVAAMREQLNAGRPIIFSLAQGPAFDAHRGSGVFDVLEPPAETTGHAMVAFGYDDAKQAVWIQNSAGPEWGEGGRAWLSYRVWEERVDARYVILDQPSAAPAAPADVPFADAFTTLKTLYPDAAPQAEANFRLYLAEKPARAFALALPDRGSYRLGNQPAGEDLRVIISERCHLRYGRPCTIVAEGAAVLPPQPAAPAPARAVYAGAYDARMVPGLSSAERSKPIVQSYGAAAGPKAMALHHWGQAFTATGQASQFQAETDALARCNADPVRAGRDGRCVLYAAGNTVVLSQRRAEPISPR